MNEILLETRNLSKAFPGVQALRDVNFDIRLGEVHILLGENGAGKSTLINILGGVYPPDSGQIILKGHNVSFHTPGDARRARISVIYQEPNLIPSMTVAENILLGNEPDWVPGLPVIDQGRQISRTLDLFDRLNLALDPFDQVSELTLAEQQMVAIARALHHSADLVVMDEPTAMLSQREVSELFSVIRTLRAQRISILYVTHRLEEVLQIGDRATTLRDGRVIGTVSINGISQDDLMRMVAGRPLDDLFNRLPVTPGAELLRLEGVASSNGIRDITFSLMAGEILGITGLVGAGGTGILRAIFGADPLTAGVIYRGGNPVTIDSPQTAINQGIGLLTEDRQGQGLVLDLTGQENMTLASLDDCGIGPFLDHRAETKIAHHYARRLKIRPHNLTRKARFLSGGTQQKIILSKWLSSQCQVLLLDEPTRGIDVGARAEFHVLLNELTQRGAGIVLVSDNPREVLGLADRIIILRAGRIAATLGRAEASMARIMAIANGGANVETPPSSA
jgi:ribose transport system ATP-binding protein